MQALTQAHGLARTFRHALSHTLITLLAVGIAFSLPVVAKYILYQWWPKVEADATLLMLTEVGLASVLVLLFNVAKIAWDNRHRVATARLASLVYARNSNTWLSRWKERRLVRRLPPVRDAFVLTLTGFDTFVDQRSPFRDLLEKAYEIRVMLLYPVGEGAAKRVSSLPDQITLQSFRSETEASLEYLAALRKLGKKVAVKFYEHEPFWKIVVLGDHVWVQYCHSGYEVKGQPEYVFALQHRNPREGFFVPFYMYFLEQWDQPYHPEFDFDRCELVYRDLAGNETTRVPFGEPVAPAKGATPQPPESPFPVGEGVVQNAS